MGENMIVVTDIAQLSTNEDLIAVMGVFDGVHQGHQALIKAARTLRTADRQRIVVFTFSPHPLQVLKPQCDIRLLSTDAERRRLLAQQGVDILCELPFTPEFAAQTPCSFVRWITTPLNIRHIVVGFNFRFGKDAAGDTSELRQMGSVSGFEVCVVPPVRTTSGQVISSTLIRKLLQSGDVRSANQMLGRAYSLQGQVVKGFGRGKKLGFPTANVQVSPHKLLPADGVYAAKALVNDSTFLAVVNIGTNPTFRNQVRTVEAHLLDFSWRDLYGYFLTLDFLSFIREERVFASAQELRRQVEKDIDCVRDLEQCEWLSNDCAFTAGG